MQIMQTVAVWELTADETLDRIEAWVRLETPFKAPAGTRGIKLSRDADRLELTTDIRDTPGMTAVHLGLCVVTAGLWLIAWAGIGLFRRNKRRTLTIEAIEDGGRTVVNLEGFDEWVALTRSWMLVNLTERG